MIGQSFAPLGDPNNPTRQQGGNGQASNPVQEAIRVLSLRLPRVLGAGTPAPGVLLNSPGGSMLPGLPGATGGAPANPLTTILRQLFGPTVGAPSMMGAPAPMQQSAPPPNVEYGNEPPKAPTLTAAPLPPMPEPEPVQAPVFVPRPQFRNRPNTN